VCVHCAVFLLYIKESIARISIVTYIDKNEDRWVLRYAICSITYVEQKQPIWRCTIHTE